MNLTKDLNEKKHLARWVFGRRAFQSDGRRKVLRMGLAWPILEAGRPGRLRWREEEGKCDYMSLSVSVFIPLWWDMVGGLRASKATFIDL